MWDSEFIFSSVGVLCESNKLLLGRPETALSVDHSGALWGTIDKTQPFHYKFEEGKTVSFLIILLGNLCSSI